MQQKILQLLIAVIALACAQTAGAERWFGDPARGKLEFSSQQDNRVFEGHFDRYFVDLQLSKDDLKSARLSTQVQMDSVSTAASKQDPVAAQQEKLYATLFPTARFEADDITVTADGLTYIANGTLTLRGLSGAALITFTLERDPQRNTARLVGWARIKRLDPDTIQGQLLDTSWTANPVKVVVDLYRDANRTALR
jgi:polyisoprenoid-binding protein YceI